MTTKQYNSAKNSRIVVIVACAAGIIFSAASIFTSDKPVLADYFVIFLFAINLLHAIIHKPTPPPPTNE